VSSGEAFRKNRLLSSDTHRHDPAKSRGRSCRAIEREARAKGLSPPEIVQLRLEKARAVLEEFKARQYIARDSNAVENAIGHFAMGS